nr:MAG TPA: hypothetical protein [Caudoviricetes sp.]
MRMRKTYLRNVALRRNVLCFRKRMRKRDGV